LAKKLRKGYFVRTSNSTLFALPHIRHIPCLTHSPTGERTETLAQRDILLSGKEGKNFNRRSASGGSRIALTLHSVQNLKPDTASRGNGSCAKVSYHVPLHQASLSSRVNLRRKVSYDEFTYVNNPSTTDIGSPM
jgi:hypothetical protein